MAITTLDSASELGLRVAVTGASGYIGGRLIERLGGQGVRKGRPYVLATDVREPRADWGDNVEFVQRDICQPLGDLLSSRRIDAVAHLAFILDPDRRGETAHRVNVGGTANVIRACEDAGVSHIVYLSSASVYGARADNPDWLTEDAPPRPLRGFTYSEHKLAAERLLVEFAARSASATISIVRACPVMGPNADNFIANAFRKPVLPILGDADPPMQLIHEDDMVETLVRCLESRPPGIYNAAGDGAIRWSEMAAVAGIRTARLPAFAWRALVQAGWALRIQNDSPAVGLDFIRHRWTVSADKIKRELGLRMRYTSRETWASQTLDRKPNA